MNFGYSRFLLGLAQHRQILMSKIATRYGCFHAITEVIVTSFQGCISNEHTNGAYVNHFYRIDIIFGISLFCPMVMIA